MTGGFCKMVEAFGGKDDIGIEGNEYFWEVFFAYVFSYEIIASVSFSDVFGEVGDVEVGVVCGFE